MGSSSPYKQNLGPPFSPVHILLLNPAQKLMAWKQLP